MSLLVWNSPLSAINPKVWNQGKALHARTSLFWQVLNLGLWAKHVVADPGTGYVTINKRILWFLKRKEAYRMADISHIDYRFKAMATSWNWFGWTEDSLESYGVWLVLENRREIHLMSFRGEGSASTGVAGVLLGDSIVDVQGNQGDKSLSYVDELQQVTGKGLSRASKYLDGPGGRSSKTKYY